MPCCPTQTRTVVRKACASLTRLCRRLRKLSHLSEIPMIESRLTRMSSSPFDMPEPEAIFSLSSFPSLLKE